AAEALDVGRGLLLLLEERCLVSLSFREGLARPLVARLRVGPGGEPALDDEARREIRREDRVLVEVGDLGPAAARERARVGLLDAAEDAGERALARAVVADEPDPLARADRERHAPEDVLRAVRLVDLLRGEDRHG